MKHTVNYSLGDEDYAALKELAEREDRHIYEQARHMLRQDLKRLSGECEPLNLRTPQPDDSTQSGHLNYRACCNTRDDGPHLPLCGAAPKPLPG